MIDRSGINVLSSEIAIDDALKVNVAVDAFSNGAVCCRLYCSSTVWKIT